MYSIKLSACVNFKLGLQCFSSWEDMMKLGSIVFAAKFLLSAWEAINFVSATMFSEVGKQGNTHRKHNVSADLLHCVFQGIWWSSWCRIVFIGHHYKRRPCSKEEHFRNDHHCCCLLYGFCSGEFSCKARFLYKYCMGKVIKL